MNLRAAFILAAATATLSPLYASAETASSPTFCIANDTFIDRFAHRLGWVELYRQSELVPLVECLVSLDNTNNSELAEFTPGMFASLLHADPAVVIHVMAQHPAVLEHWLRDLEQAFVWENDPPSPTEGRRIRLILAVDAAQVSPADAPVKERIVARLREVRSRQID